MSNAKKTPTIQLEYPLKYQVCRYEQGKKLKKHGVNLKVIPFFSHVTKITYTNAYTPRGNLLIPDREIVITNDPILHPCYNNEKIYPAFNCAELVEILEPLFYNFYTIVYCFKKVPEKYPAWQLAEFLIYALDNNIIQLDNIKYRLISDNPADNTFRDS